jgi:hypothetical protein
MRHKAAETTGPAARFSFSASSSLM